MPAPAAPSPSRAERVRVWLVTAVYTAISVYMTWPLARGLARDVPGDLGDPLLNLWILAWDWRQFTAILGGDLSRIASFFDANIFYPAPLTLAYSEHLLAQAVQTYPIFLATGNPLLCYNLLFLATFVLSGVGAYLLARELTGDWRAAFFAGLLFAFAPYRIPQSAHLQVLSSQWMPFALYGFTRYLNTGRRRALSGGAAAFVVQCLSCGYYLLYFAPFALVYVLWEIARRQRWRDRRLWIDFGVAGAATCVAVLPFFLPYLDLRRRMPTTRGLDEVTRYSADVYSYLTAFQSENIWGPIADAYPKAEGDLFLGAVTLLGMVAAFAIWLGRAWRAGGETPPRRGALGGVIPALLGAVGAVALVLAIAALFQRRFTIDLGLASIRVSDIGRVLIWFTSAMVLLVAISPRARKRARALISIEGYFCAAAVGAWWLSLGPLPRTLGRALELPAPYAVLYEYVPGFDGVRVPARLAMVVILMVTMASAIAVVPMLRRRIGVLVVAALSIAFVVEAQPTGYSVNGLSGGAGHALPENRIYRPDRAPAIYRHVATLPADAVLLELPIGDPNWDLRSVYYSATHWRRVVNGYSGFFPAAYGLMVNGLSDPDRDPELATRVVWASGATHLIVHELAFRDAETTQIRKWLQEAGATPIFRDGTDALYAIAR